MTHHLNGSRRFEGKEVFTSTAISFVEDEIQSKNYKKYLSKQFTIIVERN